MYINPIAYLKRRFSSRDDRRRLLKKICGGIIPITAFISFTATIIYWNGRNYGLVLAYEGKEIASVRDEEIYRKASDMIRSEIIEKESIYSTVIQPECKIAVISENSFVSPSEVRNKIIQSSQEIIEEASGLYVNNKLIGAVRNYDGLRDIIDDMLKKDSPVDESLQVSFTENVEIVNGLYLSSDIIELVEIKEAVYEGKPEYIDYTVKEEDTPLSIACNFGVCESDISKGEVASDNLILNCGDIVNIRIRNKLIHVKTEKTEVIEKDIPYTSVKLNNSNKYEGYSKIKQKGESGREKINERVTLVDGVETQRCAISSEILIHPVEEQIIVGTKKTEKIDDHKNNKDISGKGLIWPVPFTKNISSEYGMREGKFHKGIDISAYGVKGTAIVASADGVVEDAGDMGSYGLCVVISHNNGIRTRSAHAEKVLVKAGERISKGQTIALVGNTGQSEGAHLHFEIIVNGTHKNPRKYL